MKKILIALAFIASPAYAQEDIVAKADRELAEIKASLLRDNPALAKLEADYQATVAANRANEEKVLRENAALIAKLNKEIAEYEKEYGPVRKRPQVLRTYVYRGRYIGSTNVVCVNGRCY